MAHWLKDRDGVTELETEYNAALEEWRQLKASDPDAAYDYRKTTLSPLGDEFAKARDHWRKQDEAAGTRVGVHVQDFVDDNGNGIDDREEVSQ